MSLLPFFNNNFISFRAVGEVVIIRVTSEEKESDCTGKSHWGFETQGMMHNIEPHWPAHSSQVDHLEHSSIKDETDHRG